MESNIKERGTLGSEASKERGTSGSEASCLRAVRPPGVPAQDRGKQEGDEGALWEGSCGREAGPRRQREGSLVPLPGYQPGVRAHSPGARHCPARVA